MCAESFGEVEVEGVVWHLVGVRYGDGIVAAHESDTAPNTDKAFSDAVVEDGATPSSALVGVEDPRVDEVRRLSLHGSCRLAGTLGKEDTAAYECAVEGELEPAHAHERQVFAEVEFQSVGVGAVGVLVTIGEVGAAGNGVCPLDRAAEMLVESSEGDDFAAVALWVELVAEVGVLHVAGSEVDIALHVGSEVEIVVNRRGHFAELGAIDGHTIGRAELVQVGDTPGDVGRGESIGSAVAGGAGRIFAVAGVADKAHIVVFVTHTEIDIDGSERHIERRIGRQEGVVAGVVVAPFDLFEEIETVGGIVVFDHELRGYVESAEVGREGVGGLVPVVVERACRIVACAVFTIDTDAELGVEPTCVEGLRVVESEGGDMLVEVGVFAGYVVGGRELEDPCLEGIVDEVAAPVGLVAIGVGIACVPAETDVVVLKQVGTSELGGIGGTTLVVVFRLLLLVVLGRDTHAGGVTLSPELVEDVFEFDTVFACTAGVTEVEHQAEAGVDSLLIVSGLTQIFASLLRFVVGTKEAVEHITIVLVGATVVAAEEHGERLPVADVPTLASIEAETEVADRRDALGSPVVVEAVVGEGDAVVDIRIAFERSVDTLAEAAQPAIEAEPVGGRGLGA